MKELHPLTRKQLKNMLPFPVVANFQLGISNKINTNPYFSDYSLYPDIECDALKLLYINYLLDSNSELRHIDKTHLLFTVGASEAIELMIKAFCEPTFDNISVTPPVFSLYEQVAARSGVEVLKFGLLGENFELLDLVKLSTANSKIIFLCSPNNPIGSVLNFDQFKIVLKKMSNSIIVVDETYIDFTTNQNILPLLETHPNLVVIRSFSKAWGLAGVRAGVVIANNQIINTLKLIQLPFNFSTPAQDALITRMNKISDIKKSVKDIIEQRKRLYIFLKDFDKTIKVYPSSTNFVTALFRNQKILWKRLTKNKMLIDNLHGVMQNAIRFSILDELYMDKLFTILSRH